MPTQPAASEMRPLSSADIATLKPSPSAPSLLESGTRTPSRKTSAVSCARSPSLPLIGEAEYPEVAGRTGKHGQPPGPSPPPRAEPRARPAPLAGVVDSVQHGSGPASASPSAPG